MNNFTVSTLIKSVIVLMSVCLMALLCVTAWDSWTRLTMTSRIAVVTDASGKKHKVTSAAVPLAGHVGHTVTLVGTTAAGRAGWSQLVNLGMTELAAHSSDEFVKIVTGLATDLPRLAELRATLRGRLKQSPLMNAPRFARSMETAFRKIWHGALTESELARP